MTVSKEHFEQEGEEVAMFQGVGTGAWEYVESTTGVSWTFKAVEDHYRKTPEFAELIMWEIPEEATRVANFKTGIKLASSETKRVLKVSPLPINPGWASLVRPFRGHRIRIPSTHPPSFWRRPEP